MRQTAFPMKQGSFTNEFRRFFCERPFQLRTFQNGAPEKNISGADYPPKSAKIPNPEIRFFFSDESLNWLKYEVTYQ